MNAVRVRAPSNIALVKYWGKRSGTESLNLPATGSLSVTLDALWTETEVCLDPALDEDVFSLEGEKDGKASQRVSEFLDILRAKSSQPAFARIKTFNNFPTGAGLASSASGFAALALAGSKALGLDADLRELSRLARMGSGSAARSLFGGFVLMHRGEHEDGRDSYAEPLHDPAHWPLEIAIVLTSREKKPTGSRVGMEASRERAPYYQAWIDSHEADMAEAREAISTKDFDRLAEVTEHSCLKMHALMMSNRPPLLYWNKGTMEAIQAVRSLRAEGGRACFTIDAGPQVKVLFDPQDRARVVKSLEGLDGVHEVIVTKLGRGAEILSPDR